VRTIILIVILLTAGFLAMEHFTPHPSPAPAPAPTLVPLDASSTVPASTLAPNRAPGPGAPPTEASTRLDTSGAERLFASYVSLSNAYDPALADLYDDSARIQVSRRFEDGTVRELSFSGAQFKRAIPTLMPVAAASQEHEVYSDVSYRAQADGSVLIRATRTNTTRGFSVPHSILVRLIGAEWKIVEEVGHSPQPT
jgi:hypothetical protein